MSTPDSSNNTSGRIGLSWNAPEIRAISKSVEFYSSTSLVVQKAQNHKTNYVIQLYYMRHLTVILEKERVA